MIREGQSWDTGTRKEQQDFWGLSNFDDDDFIKHGGRLCIVCDGMGGLRNGKAASRTAVAAFLEAYKGKGQSESISDALERAVRYANEKVLEMAAQSGDVENCGTTLVAAVIHNNSLYWISVGDSHIYLCWGKNLRLLNEEHVYGRKLQAAADRGLITQEDADIHPEREALTSYIGSPELQEIDSGACEGEILSGVGVLLCSDGLHKTLSVPELSASFHLDPNQWAQNLVKAVLDKKKAHQDNVTVTILRKDGEEGPPPSIPERRKARVKTQKKKSGWGYAISLIVLSLAACAGYFGGRELERQTSVSNTASAALPIELSKKAPDSADLPDKFGESVRLQHIEPWRKEQQSGRAQ
jgi:protein phosphatase